MGIGTVGHPRYILAAVLVLSSTIIGISFLQNAYGLYVQDSPEDLLETSETIFVGDITSVSVVKIEDTTKMGIVEEGVSKHTIKNHTLNLDRYTVRVEKYLKNSKDQDTMTVTQPSLGLPAGSAAIGGFEKGDRVLFYITSLDDNYNTYSPESFKIPKQCNAETILEQPRIKGFNSFEIMQDGAQKKDNFTANKPIQFVYEKDMRTLYGSGFEMTIKVTKTSGNDSKTVSRKDINAQSNPCEWIASAKWQLVLQKGKYRMHATVKEDGSAGTTRFGTGFTVIKQESVESPLKQIQNGIQPEDVKCNDRLVLVQKYDGSPACVKPETKQDLIQRGWAKMTLAEVLENGQDIQDYPVKKPHKGGYTTEIDKVIPWLFMKELQKQGISYKNVQSGYANTDEGFLRPAKVCSPVIASNGTKLWLQAVFEPEPFEVSKISIAKGSPKTCHKIWATEPPQ